MIDPTRTASLLRASWPQPGGDTGSVKVPVVGTEETGSFADTLKGVIDQVSSTRNTAGGMIKQFAAGEQVELDQMMAAGEEAGIALELMIELRNKVLEAYRTLVTMQS
ncbi:MAG: flagellar hook-basal body complex protein FliE [Gemmatimonadaceae bacterium]|nr:flagellar hook-basal body complex protein FliE [Gemmatimonadaceae bacterium]